VTAEPAPPPEASHSVDLFLGGLVTLIQPRTGHRAGLDAALLQALVPTDAQGHAIDLGTGAGTVALSLAARVPGLRVTGVEREAALIACAEAALRHPGNRGFADRVRFVAADVTERREARAALGLPDGSADWVVMNPPFDQAGTVSASPDPARRGAHVAALGGLEAWCRTAAGLLRPDGSLAIIHRAAALPQLFAALGGRFGYMRVLPVHPAQGAAASRVLVRAVRGSRAGIEIRPGLVLHEAGGAWTEAADAVLRGRAGLAL
jgi:tRNA1(Val) A37 N6-methylase TrmN6